MVGRTIRTVAGYRRAAALRHPVATLALRSIPPSWRRYPAHLGQAQAWCHEGVERLPNGGATELVENSLHDAEVHAANHLRVSGRDLPCLLYTSDAADE